MRSWTLVVLSLIALPFVMGSGCEDDPPPDYLSPRCISETGFHCAVDQDCQDAFFCDGIERCMPGDPDADPCGCIAARPRTACLASETCDEVEDRCEACTTDADGDGHRSMECGGDDCDDSDVNRFPGNTEVCDTHDEDCNPATFGEVDADGDQFPSSTCCNTDGAGVVHCGADCDDTNPAIVPGAQVCQKAASTNVLICQANGMPSAPMPCGGALTCVTQPNGLGVCE
jgi:hypothetical protein